jgi:MSHA pilin protein MshD
MGHQRSPSGPDLGGHHSRRSRPRGSRGFTLIESLAAAAILAFAVVALCQAIVSGQMHTYAALHDLRATALAETMVEEILALPYVDPDGASNPGPETGESGRAQFDNVDDYHGFAQASGQISDWAGSNYPTEYQDFSRAVTIAYGSTTVAGLEIPTPGVTITVTVVDGGGRQWIIRRFVSEPAP